MYEHLAILLLTTTANLILGVGVWLKNPSQRVNQCFAAFSISVAGWTLSNGLVATYAATPWGIIWARAAFVSASLIPLSFFLFARIFPVPTSASSQLTTIAFVVCGAIAAVLSATPLIARSTSTTSGVLTVLYGHLHPFFGAYFILCLVYSMLVLYRKLHLLKGVERLQIRYVLVGLSLPILAGATTNLLIPLLFQSSQFSPYGPLFSIPMIAVIAHAIIRHRLMRIHIVVRRSVAYLVTICVAAVVFTTVLWLSSGLLLAQRRELPISMEVGLVLVIAIAFQPFQRAAQGWVDRYLFRDPYDYQRTVREASRRISTILELDSLLSYLAEVIERTFKVEMVAVYLRDDVRSSFVPQLLHHSSRWERPPLEPQAFGSAALADALRLPRRILVREDILGHPGIGVPLAAAEQLRVIGAEVAIPFLNDATLSGFLLVGAKLSGDPYFLEDIDLLSTLAAQADIAIKNAQLYRQVVLVNDYIENILSTIESGVIAISPDETITLFNAAAGRMTGIDPAAVKGRTLGDVPGAVADALRATTSDGQPRAQVEGLVQDTTGRLTPIICSTSVLRDRMNATLGAVAVFSDLTRLHELEGEKRRAERLASIGALASGITHEIKNPLVAIKTFAELLPERFSDNEFRSDFSKIVIQEIERIDELIARLRGMATPEYHRAPVEVRPSIQETLALLRGHMEQARVTLNVTYGDNLPAVEADKGQLKQLFLNLFMNALEAMKSGGRLAIRVDSRIVDDKRLLSVAVTDTGAGIPPHLLEKIFDPFVTTKPQGSGLGLSICRGIADAHRATIRAMNNANGRGATIVVEFPEASESVLASSST